MQALIRMQKHLILKARLPSRLQSIYSFNFKRNMCFITFRFEMKYLCMKTTFFSLPELESTAVKRAHCSANISHAKSGIEKIKEPDKNALMNVSFRVLRAFALSQGCNKW